MTSHAKVTYWDARGTPTGVHLWPPALLVDLGALTFCLLSCLHTPSRGWHPFLELRLTVQGRQEEAGRTLTSIVG